MGEAYFWLHAVVIVLAIVSGFFLEPLAVLALIILHKIHLAVFGDCILTLLKRYKGTIGSDENFLQYASRRFFGTRITERTSGYVNYGIYALTMLASLSRHLFIVS